jgi:hypothetical protein
MKKSVIINAAATGLLVSAIGVHADVKIQNAQYNESKGVVFIKGKADDATRVYVVNPATSQTLAVVPAPRGQFKKNIEVGFRVPCQIRVQTEAPARRWPPEAASSGGESSTSRVRHAPRGCQ